MAILGSYESVSSIDIVGTDIRNLTTDQLMLLGMADLAYVKPIVMNGEAAFAIHAADGSQMAMAADRALAVAAIVQHEMKPALVH